MRSNEIVKAILKEKGITVSQLSRMLGKVQQNIAYQLSNDIHCAKLAEYCDMFGYEVVIRPKRAGRKEDGAYIIGGENE